MLGLDLKKIDEIASETSKLPVLKISLNGTTLDEIRSNSKDVKYEDNSLELSFNGEVFDFSDVQIKGRGNSTWSGEKRPFQIKFSSKVDLLGFGLRKKYILLANAVDDSFVRNAAMFKMAEMIDEKYRCVGESVELYIDDDYQGLYYMTTKVEIGKAAVDLRDKYGIIMENDTLHRETEDCIYTDFKECLLVKEAVFEDDEVILADAVEDFMKDYNRLEVAAKKGDFKKVNELIDVRSFAEYFIVSEFAVNPDAYNSSFNFYKDGKDDKIHAGPLWDYDYAFGNRNWSWTSNENFYSPTETMIRREVTLGKSREKVETGKLIYYLIEIPEFKAEVERVFRDKLSGRKTEFLMKVLNEAAKVRVAAEKDAERWEKDKETFYKEVKYLLNWINERYDYFEKEYGKKEWDFKSGVI